jgi:hypothetical protein
VSCLSFKSPHTTKLPRNLRRPSVINRRVGWMSERADVPRCLPALFDYLDHTVHLMRAPRVRQIAACTRVVRKATTASVRQATAATAERPGPAPAFMALKWLMYSVSGAPAQSMSTCIQPRAARELPGPTPRAANAVATMQHRARQRRSARQHVAATANRTNAVEQRQRQRTGGAG